jgi:hypothetical protein
MVATPGVRENGGQYTRRLLGGGGDEAAELFHIFRART